MPTVDQLMDKGLRENPEVALVLEIAERARAAGELDPPQEIYVSSEVTAVRTFSPQGSADFIAAYLA
jgi:hypothetical protein